MQKLMNFLRGSVRLEVAGAFPERFLNLCAQKGISFWGVEWLGEGAVRLTVAGWHRNRLGPLAEKVMCGVEEVSTEGLPYFLRRFRKRYALLLGLALALLSVGALSQFILTVEVSGNQAVPTARVLAELRRQGLRVGAYGPGIDSRQVAYETLLHLEDLSWMAVNLHGTRAEVLVRERVAKPEIADEGTLGDVIAEAPGIITHMEVLAGEPVCREGDTVNAGDIVIAGDMVLPVPKYSELAPAHHQVRAQGRVYARTWRTLAAQIPLTAGLKTYSGEEEARYSLFLLGKRINFYGNGGIPFPQYDKISDAWTMTLPSGRVMPLTLTREKLRAYSTASVTVDRDAAQALLEERLDAALREALGDGEAVKSAYSAVVKDGALTVTLRAECKEEIGKFAPFSTDGAAPVES